MKYILTIILTFLPGLALAHPGHTEVVDGHGHTLMELAAYGAIPVAVLALVAGYAIFRRGNK